MRVNLLAALSSAVSAAMWFLITERVLVSWFAERWQRIAGGALAVVIGSTAFTVWAQSVVNEKVYTVSLVGLAVTAWLVVRWCDEPDGPRADRILVLVAYLMGLGYANHMAGMLAGPAAAIAVLVRRPQTLLRWKLLLACFGALILGGSPFLSQPIRAAHFPAINEGEPTACRTELALSCTFSKGTKDAFMYNFNRGQYGKPNLSERQAPFSAQIGMWWLYFKWQWWRDHKGVQPGPQLALAVVFLILGVLGGWVHWQRDRKSFWFFGPLMFTMTIGLIYYLNFRYGASQSPELGDSVLREVRDRDYFYLWSFSAWSVWAALGLIYIWESVAALIGSEPVQVGKEVHELPRQRSWAMASPVLLLVFVPMFGNWQAASRKHDTDTRDFAHDLLNSVEPYGVLVTVGDNDTFPLWYAQEVEGIRKDVLIANTSLMNTDWYVRQMIRRPIHEYDKAKGPKIYADREWPKPTGPALKMTMEEADLIPLAYDLQQPQIFEKDKIRAIIDPRNLQRGLLERADIVVLRLIMDSYPTRPMYFSRTSANYASTLGLEQYMLTQGLARKMMPEVPKAGKDTVLLPGQGFVDIPRTRALWFDVFQAPDALVRKGIWVDKPSVGIPYLYVATGLILSESLAATGRSLEAEKVFDTTKKVAAATGLNDLFGPAFEQPATVPLGDSLRTIPITPVPPAAPATAPPRSRKAG
jgi:hypothetical protein